MAKEKKDKVQRGRYCGAGVRNRKICQNRSFIEGMRMQQFPTDPVGVGEIWP